MAESAGILLLNAEDNSESGLTITEEGSNNFSIATGAKAHGTYGYQFAFDGTNNICAFSKSFTAGADIYARLYFYIPSAFAMTNSYLDIFRLYEGTVYLAYARFINSSGTISLQRLYYRTNSGTAYVSISGAITRDAWHYIELRYKSDASAGIVEIWYDGTKKAEATGLATSSYQTAGITAGQTEAGVPTTDSPFYIDDIKVDSSYIGAYADVSSGSIVPIILAMNHFNGGM
jgi:hypothetical protein